MTVKQSRDFITENLALSNSTIVKAMVGWFVVSFFSSLACDVVASKLEAAIEVGADVVINCSEQNLRDCG